MQGDTFYESAAGASFREPNVVVSDPIDAYSLTPTKQYRICNTPPASAYGTTAGALATSALVCRSTAVYYIDAAAPNRPGEVYVITYTATNSRGM